MKQLIVMSACPGSGKSTWTKKFCKEHDNVKIISSDEVRFELTGDYNDFSKQDLVWKTIDERVVNYANFDEDNYIVILDACIDLNFLREKYAKLGSNYDKKTLVCIEKPLEVILENNKKRNPVKHVPEDILIQMYNKFEHPTDEVVSLYDEFIFIDKYFE